MHIPLNTKACFPEAEFFARTPKFRSNLFLGMRKARNIVRSNSEVVRRKVEPCPTFSQIPLELFVEMLPNFFN